MDRDDLDEHPVHQLRKWIEEARLAGDPMPEAMCLATAGADCSPAARMVLLRGLDSDLVFFSDYGSAKAADLRDNPRAAALFHFRVPAHRQVRVAGTVVRASATESDRYWATRPVESRWSALASHQSEVIASRRELDEAVAGVAGDPDPARPDRWGGFRLTPESVEFWEEGRSRLHDRIRFRKIDGGWLVERLSP